MNRNQFFETVRLARAKVCVIQDGDKGFKLTAYIQHGDEEKEEISLLYNNEARYFKNLNSVAEIMRERKVKHFETFLHTDNIAQNKRGPRSTTAAKKSTPATKKAPATA